MLKYTDLHQESNAIVGKIIFYKFDNEKLCFIFKNMLIYRSAYKIVKVCPKNIFFYNFKFVYWFKT